MPTRIEDTAGGKCFTNLPIFDTIILHLDGKTILQLAVTCKWVWGLLRRSRVQWRRVLSNHEDLAQFPGAHLRTAHTLVILHFSQDCVMCGCETSNPVLSNHAVRLCDSCSVQHLVAAQTHTIWHNGPHPVVEPVFLPDINSTPNMTVYPAEPVQMPPLDFDILLNSQQEPAEQAATTDEVIIPPMQFYTDTYLNPNYSSGADIDRGCGFPTDWDDEDLTGLEYVDVMISAGNLLTQVAYLVCKPPVITLLTTASPMLFYALTVTRKRRTSNRCDWVYYSFHGPCLSPCGNILLGVKLEKRMRPCWGGRHVVLNSVRSSAWCWSIGRSVR
ncbi:hypothetical protein B0J17DRAFT_677563 [Rhizoctonia solani]|nr:hypothetical protein B0J17DRAFT_677563 [Rhizoctonia solani]